MDKPTGTNRVLQNNKELHEMIHDCIDKARVKILMADIEISVGQRILDEEIAEGNEKGIEYGKILMAIANIDCLQAKERKKFFSDLHDKYFPDGLDMAD